MRLGVAGALALLGLLAGPALAQAWTGWTQIGGNAGHSGELVLAPGPLDVRAAFRFLEPGEILDTPGMGLVETPHGFAAIGVQDAPTNSCRYLLVDPERRAARSVGEPFSCPYGGQEAGVVGYVPSHDLVLACLHGSMTDDVFHAWRPLTGERAWSVTPLEIGGASVTAGAASRTEWFCQNVAIEGTEAVVPFAYDPGRNRLARIDLEDGAVVWSRAIAATAFLPNVPAPARQTLEGPGFLALAATATATGYVVVGATEGSNAAVWTDHEGRPTGGVLSGTTGVAGGEAPRRRDMASAWAAAQGQLAALYFDGALLLVDPLSPEPVVVPVSDRLRLAEGVLPAPVWHGETVIVPMGASIVAVDVVSQAPRWTWAAAGWQPLDLLVAVPGDVYVAAYRETAVGQEAALVRLDLDGGRVLQHLPIPVDFQPPLAPEAATALPSVVSFHMLPWRDGLLFYDRGGTAVVLGAADPERLPDIEVDTLYPPPAQPVSLVVRAPPGAQRVLVAWGDQSVDEAVPGEPVLHQYSDPGHFVVRVTAVYADNRTATRELALVVGGTPPPELNFMQRAFAPENQETTYAVGGLTLTLVGAAVATVEKRRRRGRVGQEIHALHRIRDRANDYLPGALRDLHVFHVRIERDHAAGRLDDGQFGALELREARLRDTLRNRVLGPVAGRVTPRFLRALDHAFEDGRLEPHEAAQLRAALADEANLAADERARLAALFDAWSAGGGAP